MKLSSLKISQILYGGFGLLVMVYLLSSLVNAEMMRRMHSNLEQIENSNNAQITIAHALYKAVSNVSLSVRKVILLNTDEEIAAETRAYKKEAQNYKAVREKLSHAFGTAAPQASWSKVDAAQQAAAPLLDKLYLAMQEHRDSEAINTLKQLSEAIDVWQAALDEGIELQQRANSVAFDDSNKVYRFALLLLLVIAVVSVLLAVGVSIGIVRILWSQLGAEPKEAAEVASRIGAGDLTQNIHLRHGDQSSLMAAMKSMQQDLVQVVLAVRSGSESVATASDEIAQGNHDLSARTERQAGALEETAASMEDLGSTVQQNASSAQQASQLAMTASQVAIAGGEVVAQVVLTMKGINESSNKISDITSVIDSIAFQTNILALNAAVEAARAGEQGRGFAVVASEVRLLASRSAEAAKEIKHLIGTSAERVEHGSALVDQAGHTMTEVVTAIQRVTDIMGEISAASVAQNSGMAEVGEAVSQMDHATQQNAALVEQIAAAASSLRSQSKDLVDTVAQFRLASI